MLTILLNSYPNFAANDFNFNRGLIQWYEYPLLLVYCILLIMLGQIIKKLFFRGSLGSRYYFPALLLSLFSGIFICLVYNYYYVGGDTLAYFNDGRLLHKVFWNSPKTAIDIFFNDPINLREEHPFIYHNFRFLRAKDTYMMVRLSFIAQFFALGSFLVTSALFGFLSFLASWSFYQLIVSRFPSISKYLAYSVLFMPSVLVWGSGIFKDTACLIFLYVLIYAAFQLYSERKILFSSVVLFLLALYMITILKIYITIVLLFTAAFFISFSGIKKVKNMALKLLIAPTLFVVGFYGFYRSFEMLGAANDTGRYSTENILRTVEITSSYLQYLSERDDGSGYSLGEVEYTLNGLLLKAPQAINVTLFRPYLWEIKNPLMFLSALESSAVLILTLYIVFRTGFMRFLLTIYRYPVIASMLIYSLAFSFSIGISTYNFGTLVRYKIPILPFYLISLALIYYYNLSAKSKQSGIIPLRTIPQ